MNRWPEAGRPPGPTPLKQGRNQIGRVLYSDFARLYSCFIGEPSHERFLGCTEYLKAAKMRDGDTIAKKDAEPKAWTFHSTADAYGACQVREEIRDGDVLVIEREQVIGIAHTWPFALTEKRGDLHTLKTPLDPRTWEDGKHAPGVAVAEREAARMGVPLTRVDATATEPANETEGDRG
ncbi:hypothetical protein [Streptomyces sp. NPDC093149]|uniref:hypothetical protein n=1 Tax=Streptomyces sp. NPDC093149 TaxID=3366031 RepID=UPI0038120D0B